jgi:hypothetical protein
MPAAMRTGHPLNEKNVKQVNGHRKIIHLTQFSRCGDTDRLSGSEAVSKLQFNQTFGAIFWCGDAGTDANGAIRVMKKVQ